MTTQDKLNDLLKKRERLLDKGGNDEKLNDKIRECQKIIYEKKEM